MVITASASGGKEDDIQWLERNEDTCAGLHWDLCCCVPGPGAKLEIPHYLQTGGCIT